MAKHLTELCTLLVDDLYGELSCRVFSILTRFGRLTLNQIHTYSHLSRRHVKHGLVVLIQQHLALHYTREGEDSYYEADWDNAYALIRSGKLIKAVERRFGGTAGRIVSNLLEFGHARIGDLIDAYNVISKKKSVVKPVEVHINGEGLPNGVGNHGGESKINSSVASLAELNSALQQLLDAGYIAKVHRTHYYPLADLDSELYALVTRQSFPTGVKGTKAKVELRSSVLETKRKWLEEGDSDNSGTSHLATANGAHHLPRKRPRTNATLPESDRGDLESPHMDSVVRLYYEKCNVTLRNQQLVDLASRCLGETTSEVYAALLRRLEDKIPRCYDEFAEFPDTDAELDASPTVTVRETARALSPNLDLSVGLVNQSDGTETQRRNRSATGILNDRVHDDFRANIEDSDDDLGQRGTNGNQVQLSLVKLHIRILADSPHRFVLWAGTKPNGGDQWRVDFRSLVTHLIQAKLESVVSTRFGGPLPVRIVRILAAKGKLDEKQVATIGLMRQKDIRGMLGAMQEAGFVETQEVPKDNQRQPSRTMYFWFWDLERCRMLVLNETYKAMARVMQRIKVEKDKVRPVIEKAERTDVVGHEDVYLSGAEKGALRRWREVEEKLLCQLARMDDMVALLRDFIGRPP